MEGSETSLTIFYIACQTRKGDMPEFLRHENQPTPPSLSKMGDMWTGKKADLLKCLECSPLGSGNADGPGRWNKQQWLGRQGWPCHRWYRHCSFLILSVELSLNLVHRKRNNWSAKTLLHTAHLKQMWRSLMVHLLFKCSPPGHQTFSRSTATVSSCLTFLDNFRVFDDWIL